MEDITPSHLSHLELSRPCDLRKFLSRFLDKNATSSSFVLVRKENLCSRGSVPDPEQMLLYHVPAPLSDVLG